jgi:trehalose 6-phosphate phosphatase
MIPILKGAGLLWLGELARSRPLLAFDFDGTLAPIVAHPEDAAMRPDTRGLLLDLAHRYPCAVISGRGRSDVKQKLSGIPLVAVVGNHGMEPTPGMDLGHPRTAQWKTRIAAEVGKVPGLRIEDKGLTLAVHYRQVTDKTSIRRAILRVAGDLSGSRIVEGKRVVNILPENAEDKASALLTICRRFRRSSAIYVGDDENDEVVFALASEGLRLLGIRVGLRARSQAQAYLRGQRDMERLLATLIALRG